MITTIKQFKIYESNADLIKHAKDANLSTEKIFGKFANLDMYKESLDKFYNECNGNIDDCIDKLQTKEIDINEIYPTQRSININSFKDKLTGSKQHKNDLPFVIHNKLGYFILDGHHRLALAKIKKDKYVEVKIFEDI